MPLRTCSKLSLIKGPYPALSIPNSVDSTMGRTNSRWSLAAPLIQRNLCLKTLQYSYRWIWRVWLYQSKNNSYISHLICKVTWSLHRWKRSGRVPNKAVSFLAKAGVGTSTKRYRIMYVGQVSIGPRCRSTCSRRLMIEAKRKRSIWNNKK
jgi:hypothetical protein